MKAKRAVIFVNGELYNLDATHAVLHPGDYIVAADGGLNHIKRLGLKPALVVGDMDSISADELEHLEETGVRIIRFSEEKDETDLDLALKVILSEGFTTIRIIGALGGRLDQTLGNLYLLSKPELADCNVRLDDGQQEVFVIRNSAVIEGQPGDKVSLIPLGEEVKGVITEGLHYPLQKETLLPHQTRGISNILLRRRAMIKIDDGLLVCVHSRKDKYAHNNLTV